MSATTAYQQDITKNGLEDHRNNLNSSTGLISQRRKSQHSPRRKRRDRKSGHGGMNNSNVFNSGTIVLSQLIEEQSKQAELTDVNPFDGHSKRISQDIRQAYQDNPGECKISQLNNAMGGEKKLPLKQTKKRSNGRGSKNKQE